MYTLNLSIHLCPDSKSHYLQYLRYALHLPGDMDIIPHRADADVIVLCSLLIYMQVPYKEMVDISSKPVDIKNMPFGKHKGQLITAMPKSYIEWALRLPALDEDLRHSLRKAISV